MVAEVPRPPTHSGSEPKTAVRASAEPGSGSPSRMGRSTHALQVPPTRVRTETAMNFTYSDSRTRARAHAPPRSVSPRGGTTA